MHELRVFYTNTKRCTQSIQELALLYKKLQWMVLITFQIRVIYLAVATSSKYAAQRNITAVYNYVFLGNHSFSPFSHTSSSYYTCKRLRGPGAFWKKKKLLDLGLWNLVHRCKRWKIFYSSKFNWLWNFFSTKHSFGVFF